MKTPTLFLAALALLAAPFFSGNSAACPACEAFENANRPLNDRNPLIDKDQQDVLLPNNMDPWTEPTLRDEVRLNNLDPWTEPTLRDEIRLNQVDIYSEPTLRDEIVVEDPAEVQ